jgi:D-hydantoinase
MKKKVDLLIKGGMIVASRGLSRACIAIENGIITSVCKEYSAPKADKVLSVKDKVLLPGAIDAHAHIHDGKFRYKEDFETGSKAALAGGVTTLIDMPLTSPVDNRERLVEKIETGERLSHVDFSLHAGMMNQKNLKNIPSIVAEGVRSFKVFTCSPHSVSDETMLDILEKAKESGSIVNFHAENKGIISYMRKIMDRQKRMDPLAHHEARPKEAEQEAVSRVILLARFIGESIHISHLSSRQALESVWAAKNEGAKVTAETCPHYLFFTKRDVENSGPYLKVNPPLRSKEDVAAMWSGLKKGMIDILTSEHAPGTQEEKEVGWSNIWKAWSGLPSVETMLPLLLSEGVNKQKLSLSDVHRVLCENPARIFGFYGRKGDIAPGFDADIVVVDLKLEKKVSVEKLHYKVNHSPYEGSTFKGWPVTTIVRGNIVYDGESIVNKSGYGKFIPMKMK